MEEYLTETTLLNKNNPSVTKRAFELTKNVSNDREKAIAIHDFVRDKIKFGWTSSFYRMSASEVLNSEVGFCQNKTSLFVALLRAIGIPARMHFVALNQDVLRGFVDTKSPYVDHTYSEVYIDGNWIATDSYTIDSVLYSSAKAKLEKEGSIMGYGIHINGTPVWDGISDTFVQCVKNKETDEFAHVEKDYGIFQDINDFYNKMEGYNKLSGLKKIILPLFITFATRKVEKFREG